MKASDFDFQPQLPEYEGWGKEHSLRHIIYMHYRKYFDEVLTTEVTNQYIAAFLDQVKE